MDIEKAKERLKLCSTNQCNICGRYEKEECMLERNRCEKTVLSELEKKDRIINEMAEEIFECNEYIDNEFERELNFKTKEEVIEYFTNKVG